MPGILKITQHFLTGLIAWLLISTATAQHPLVQKIRVTIPGKEPHFTRALQDQEGYLWFGSQDGLFRFDGHSFRQILPPSDTIDLHVTALYKAEDEILWIGCKDGRILSLYDEKISPEANTPGQAITDIINDQTGNLWWSTAGAGVFYKQEDRIYSLNHSSPSGLPDDYIYDLELTSNGDIWAGTDAGAVLCKFQASGLVAVKPDSDIRFPDIMVRVIKEDAQKRLWLGFQDGGTGYLTPDRGRFIPAVTSNDWIFGAVNDMMTMGDVNWIGTANGTLVEIPAVNHQSALRIIRSESDRFGKIHDLLEDREGNVWIVSASGLYRSSGNRFGFLRSNGFQSAGNIHAIHADENKPEILWFSNDDGLFSFDLVKGTREKYLSNFNEPGLKVTSIMQDNYGYIWAGTFNYGAFRIQPANGDWIRVTEKQGLVNDNVLSISRHEDTLWMATLGGASEIILHGKESNNAFRISSFSYKTGLVNNYIYSVYEDKLDQIWLATDGNGINVKTKNGWINYNEDHGLTDDVIYSITGDEYRNIWLATASQGIFKFSGGKFINYGLQEGLSNLNITAIATVGDEVVIINDNGIDILHIPTGRIAHYGEETGLLDISPDLNVITKDAAGNFWIGTQKGIIRYQPGHENTSYGPVTVLEEMAVFLEPKTMHKNLALSYNENHVSFKYDGFWFANPEKVSYQVLLEGYDLGWKDTYDRQVTYSSLQPGQYTFKVRSSLSSSFINATEASFSFTIRRPFWLNDWFILLLILLSGGLIYSIIIYREQRLRKVEREKKEKVEFEFQVLKNQVNPHFLFNSFSTLISLIEEQPDEAVHYTEKLSDFFRTILQFKDHEVISLQEELSLIENYFFLLKKRFGNNLNLEISLKDEINESFIPPMTLQILLENAVKHNVISKDKPLFIRIYEEEGMIVVENNLQPKQTAEVSTGIGLENIRKRYRLITKAEPELDKGERIFKIKLPVIKG